MKNWKDLSDDELREAARQFCKAGEFFRWQGAHDEMIRRGLVCEPGLHIEVSIDDAGG